MENKMQIIKSSGEMGTKELYDMSLSSVGIQKMSDNVDSIVDVDRWLIYEKTDSEGEIVTILSISNTEGKVFATNSPTFRKSFEEIIGLTESTGEKLNSIKIVNGISKNGRTFITCVYEG